MIKSKIVLIGPKKDYPIFTFLSSFVREENCEARYGIEDVSIPFDQETAADVRAELLSRACLNNARGQYPDAEMIASVACFAGYDDPDPDGVGMISDPTNARELTMLFSSVRPHDSEETGSYCLYVSASLCFPKQQQGVNIVPIAFYEEIALKVPMGVFIHLTSEYKHSGPNMPFEGYFREYLLNADPDLVNLSGKLARELQRQCSDRGYAGLFISKVSGQRKE